MDDKTREALTRHLLAVKALMKSSEKAILQGMYDGTGQTLVRQYQLLQPKISELLPDDFYIKEMLVLDLNAESSEEEKVGLVRLLCDQMVEYLNGIMRMESRVLDARGVIAGDINDIKNLGRDLQDQILTVTKKALQRALSHIDISVDVDPPTPPVPPVPPVPPTPPVTPTPPGTHEHNDID